MSAHVLTNVEIHNARIRYQVARDQFDYELERHFKLAHFGLTKDLAFPGPRLEYWRAVMEKMEATGWGRLVR